MSPPAVGSLEELIACMDREGYDWDESKRLFWARRDGPAAGRIPLTVRQALEAGDPDRYFDRSNELRDPLLPPVRWPPWA